MSERANTLTLDPCARCGADCEVVLHPMYPHITIWRCKARCSERDYRRAWFWNQAQRTIKNGGVGKKP